MTTGVDSWCLKLVQLAVAVVVAVVVVGWRLVVVLDSRASQRVVGQRGWVSTVSVLVVSW